MEISLSATASIDRPPVTDGDVLIVTEHDDVHGAALATSLLRSHGIEAIMMDLRDFPDREGSFRLGADGHASRFRKPW